MPSQSNLETILNPSQNYSSLNPGSNTRQQEFTINSIQEEIKQREEIKQNNLILIQDSLDEKCSSLLNFKSLTSFYAADNFNKQKLSLSQEILKLEQEQRQEQVKFWQDIIFLKIRLFYELNKYSKIKTRMELLK